MQSLTLTGEFGIKRGNERGRFLSGLTGGFSAASIQMDIIDTDNENDNGNDNECTGHTTTVTGVSYPFLTERLF